MLFGLLKSLDEKVKEDKERLISKLKSADIRTLICEMDNNEPISDNIIKKQKRDSSFSNEDSPSWYAYRISDELNDKIYKSELIQLLNEQDFLKYKKYVLRCLSSLCVNTNDYELFDFLILNIQYTDNEEIVTCVLSRLRELRKPETLNIDYLKHLFVHGSYQNRIDALSALQNSEHKDIEELLIQEFTTADKHTKAMICATLRSTGSTKCFDILKSEHKRTRSGDLRYFIESAIDEINKRENSSS